MLIVTRDISISHSGIKGQKWGVRRFQNEDGTLTEEGKKRYYTSEGWLTKEGKEENAKFYQNLRKNFDKTLKRAAEELDIKLKEINAKPEYQGIKFWGDDGHAIDNKKNRQYVKEIGKAWTDIYTKHMLKDFGTNPLFSKNGKDWIKYTESYHVYDDLFDDY